MKRKTKSRLLALATAMTMVVSSFAGVAYAAEGQKASPLKLEDQTEVRIEKSDNGSVKFYDGEKVTEEESKLVNKDEKVELEVKANDGYELEKLEAKTTSGETSQIEVKDNKAEVTATEDTVIKATFKSKSTENATEEQKQPEEVTNTPAEQPASEDNETGGDDVTLMPSKSEEVVATTSTEQYLKENVSANYANVKSFKTVGSMTIAPTLATEGTTSLDDLWAAQNIDKFKSAGYSTVALYDVDKNSDYYVAYAQPQVTDAKFVQALAAKNNTKAELRKDVVYDNGVVYVPKKYDTNNDTRIQLLYTTTDESVAKTEVSVKNNGVEGNFVENLVVTSKPESNVVQFKITKDGTELDYYSVKSIKINGKEVVNDMKAWAIKDSTIIINGVPASINKVEIELSNDAILVKPDAPAWYTSPVMTLPGTWEFGHEPQVNEVLKINAVNDYHGYDTADITGYHYGNSTAWQEAGYQSKYIYPAEVALGLRDPKLDDLDAMHSDSTRTSQIVAQTVGDVKIPASPTFSLICSHIGVSSDLEYAPGANNPATVDPGLRVRILGKSGNTLLCSFISPTAYTQAGVGIYKVTYQAGGKGKVQKANAKPEESELLKNCPLYTLAGAEYTFYGDEACTDARGTVTTDANGTSTEISLKAGTYYAKETKAPYGYLLNSKVYPVTVTNGQTTVVDVKDIPMFDPINLLVNKKIEKGADKSLSVEGAEFEVKYYASVGDITGAEPVRTWKFKADANGDVKYRDSYKIGGDELLKDSNGAPTALVGTCTIKETKAPKGLALDERTIYVRITPNADNSDVTQSYSEVPSFENAKEITKGAALFDQIEKTQKVNLIVKKVDAENAQGQEFGTLAGAIYSVFRVEANTETFVVDIVTDAAGIAKAMGLAPGRYTIKEKTPSKGYLLDSNIYQVDAKIKEINTAFFDYAVTSKETPTNTIVEKYTTDINGKKHPVVGAKLQLVDVENSQVIKEWVTEKKPTSIKGLTDGNMYTIKEVEAPAGFETAEPTTFTVKGTSTVVSVEDKIKEPKITTLATAQDGTHFIDGTKTEQIINEKMMTSDLAIGAKYRTVAKLAMVPTTDAAKAKHKELTYVQKDGKDYELTKEFTADSEKMTHDFQFKIDATKYASYKLVVVEELELITRDGNRVPVGRHAKLDNEDQTVRVSMLLDINIAKADANNVGHFLKGAEITVFNEDGTVAKDVNGKDAIGITDENGKVSFSIPYSFEHKYYVQETKAPNGYAISHEKFEVKPTGDDKLGTDLIKINVLDEALIIPPTGVDNKVIGITGGIAALALVGLLVLRRKQKKQ
jgi:hypothetical protein